MAASTTPLTIREPEGEPTAGILVPQEAFGVNDHIADICRRLADEGYLAVAPHLFHRSGDPKFGYDDFSQVMPHMQALEPAGLDADIAAALDVFAQRGIEPSAIGAVGFCMGGTLALYVATRFDVGAAVTFYGGGVSEGRWGLPPLVELAPTLRAPWLGLFGDLDQAIPVDDVEALRAAAETADVPTEVVRYADAGHGFNCDQRSSHHEPSAVDAWRRTLQWFTRLG